MFSLSHLCTPHHIPTYPFESVNYATLFCSVVFVFLVPPVHLLWSSHSWNELECHISCKCSSDSHLVLHCMVHLCTSADGFAVAVIVGFRSTCTSTSTPKYKYKAICSREIEFFYWKSNRMRSLHSFITYLVFPSDHLSCVYPQILSALADTEVPGSSLEAVIFQSYQHLWQIDFLHWCKSAYS